MIHCLIPARGGSKGVPGKNLRVVQGASLLVRAIGIASSVGTVTVSTDDDEIRKVAEREGAFIHIRKEVPDDQRTIEVVWKWINEPDQFVITPQDVLVLLQPTSPFRKVSTVMDCIAAVEGGKASACAVRPQFRPIWDADGAMLVPRIRRQESVACFTDTGACYAFRRDVLERMDLVAERDVALIQIGPTQALDIDTELDLKIANAI